MKTYCLFTIRLEKNNQSFEIKYTIQLFEKLEAIPAIGLHSDDVWYVVMEARLRFTSGDTQ